MKKSLLMSIAVGLAMVSSAFAVVGSTATTQTSSVSVNVAAEAAISVPSDVTLTSLGTNFADYTGTTNFNYFIRTGATNGTGAITMYVSTDFAPAGGPSVANPPTSGDTLKYTPTVSSPGVAASGPLTAAVGAGNATNVGTFGIDAHSTKAGNAASVAWVLSNDPLYKTGSYTAVITWTISAT